MSVALSREASPTATDQIGPIDLVDPDEVSRAGTGPDLFRFPGGATAAVQERGDDWLTVSVTGELDAFDEYAIVDALTSHLLSGIRTIRIDARGLRFVDLTAARALQRVRRFLSNNGGTLVVYGMAPNVGRAWSLVGGDDDASTRARRAPRVIVSANNGVPAPLPERARCGSAPI